MTARILITIIATLIAVSALAQTQPTRPTAYPTMPTFPSAFATPALSPCFPRYGDFEVARSRRFGYGRSLEFFNPESPCYSGTIYPSYSAVTPSQLPSKPRAKSEGSESLNEDQALLRIGAKGYLDISGLEKDKRGFGGARPHWMMAGPWTLPSIWRATFIQYRVVGSTFELSPHLGKDELKRQPAVADQRIISSSSY